MLLGSHVGVSGVAITVPTISVTIIKGWLKQSICKNTERCAIDWAYTFIKAITKQLLGSTWLIFTIFFFFFFFSFSVILLSLSYLILIDSCRPIEETGW